MGFVIRSGAAAAVAAVTVATTTAATPMQRPVPVASGVGSSSLINLTASSRMLFYPLADQIDNQFIGFRNTARTDFHTFANELGYLGKQLYIAVNFGETIAASAVFNGTDMLRCEGVLKNLSEMADDAFLAGVYVVVDNLYLALPGLPPFFMLPARGPRDGPPEWRRPLPPQPGRPLVVPFPDGPAASDALTDDDSTLTDDHSIREKNSVATDVGADVAADVAAASTPATDDSVVRPPADDESAVAEGADEQEDRQQESEGQEQPAGTTLPGSGSDNVGATHAGPRVTRPGRA